MRKTRTENGITLMALIITIVVLLVLATVAISSIKNDGIISKTQDVANKFNQAQTNEQGILDQYLSYLQGEQWVTIYEGDTETVNGELLLANKHLFKAGKTYKITVKSKEFSGEVTTVAVLAYTSSSLEYYVLFGVNGGNAITASSMEEYEKLQDTIGENATVVMGANTSDSTNGNMSGIILEGNTCEYKITKIEQKVEQQTDTTPQGELIFEGELALTYGGGTEISNLVGTFRPERKYKLNLTINGENAVLYTFSDIYGGLDCLYNDEVILIMMDRHMIANAEGLILNSIYDIGPSDNYVGENGFYVWRPVGYDEWELMKSPQTNYIIPETVGGMTVSGVCLDMISGTPTFDRVVELVFTGEYMKLDGIKVIINDKEFIELIISYMFHFSYPCLNEGIDLTECGDDIEFSEEIFTKYESMKNEYNIDWKIYVTSAVKANYADYDFIQVKQ